MKYIIGMGNTMRSDDGIGPHIVEYIVKKNLEDNFQALDFATNAWGILPLLSAQTEKILIIDCSCMGLTPGSFKFFALNSIVDKEINSVESHESSIAQLIKTARQSNYIIPDIMIMGIEPESLEFKPTLSIKLEQKLAHYSLQAIQTLH